MIRLRHLLFGAALVASCASPAARPQPPPDLAADLDAFVAKTMEISATPGLAVAVVRDSEIVYAKGFGFADRETGRRVTANTQFYIASTTKSFTALAGQLLDERGVIDLDTSLRNALPSAQFHPQVDAEQITLRELLTHTHGIAMGGPVDFRAAYTGDQTNALQMAVLKFHGPASTGKTYVYNNLGFNIFGLALDEQLKEGWKHVLQREIFDPLGMHLTTGWKSKADPNNLALPYELRASGHERVPYAKDDANMHAAGGLVSTAADLARYLIAHLNGGRLDGQQALPESAIKATHRQHARQDGNSGSFHRFGVGLGWDLATYGGERVLQRFGGFPGFHSHVSFMPARGIGVVILANAGSPSSRGADAIATYVFDLIRGTAGLVSRGEEKLASLKVQTNVARERVAFDLDARRKRPQTTPLALDAYAGTYESPAYGRMDWTVDNGRLRVRMGIAASDVEVFDGAQHQFRVELTGSGQGVTFEVPAGAQLPVAVLYMNERFVRRPS